MLSELYLVSSRFGFISHGRLIKEVDKDELDRINQNGLLIDVDQSSKAAMLLDRQGIGPFQVLDDHHILIRQKKGSREDYFADLLNKDSQESRRQQ